MDEVRTIQIVQFKLRNPNMALRKVGEIFGISGERVRQICSVYQVETSRVVDLHPCKGCGIDIVGQRNRKFCSDNCLYHYLYTALVCHTCNQIFYRRRTVVIKQEDDSRYKGRNYCSRECSARGMSKNMIGISKRRVNDIKL